MLAQFILESGEVDSNLCNRYGESLLVLCCKGGAYGYVSRKPDD